MTGFLRYVFNRLKNKNKVNKQKGVIHLALPLVLLLLIVAGFFALSYFGVIKLPSFLSKLPFASPGSKVELKAEYKNPFDKETQFVNPFQEYKNPFVTNK